jgi:transposase-like protein
VPEIEKRLQPHLRPSNGSWRVDETYVRVKGDGELWRSSRLRQCKFLNNIVERDHRRVKRLVRPRLGFRSFYTARRTLTGYELMAMVRKGQLRKIDRRDMRAQATFVTELFQTTA